MDDAASIYLDNAATTRLAPEAFDAMLPALGAAFGNPSSVHERGVAAERLLSEARRTLADALGASPQRIVLCSGATEANALAVLGTARRRKRPGHLICTAIEHPSVLETCRQLVDEGWALTEIGVDGEGLVDPAEVVGALRRDTALVTIQHANNILGAVQPLKRIARAVRAANPKVAIHADCVQSFLKEAVSIRRLGLDLLTVSAHKVHGPQGVGALALGERAHVAPLWGGGDQESAYRPGTQNLAGALGFAAAVRRARQTRKEDLARMATLRDELVAALLEVIPGVRVNGPSEAAQRLPHLASLSLPGVRSEPLLHELDARGLTASAGSACHASRRSLSHVLQAVGYSEQQAWGHLRLSLSRETTAEEVRAAVRIIAEAYERLRAAGVGG